MISALAASPSLNRAHSAAEHPRHINYLYLTFTLPYPSLHPPPSRSNHVRAQTIPLHDPAPPRPVLDRDLLFQSAAAGRSAGEVAPRQGVCRQVAGGRGEAGRGGYGESFVEWWRRRGADAV